MPKTLTEVKIFASIAKLYAVLAQLDRASGFEPEGRGFESLTPHHKTIPLRGRFVLTDP